MRQVLKILSSIILIVAIFAAGVGISLLLTKKPISSNDVYSSKVSKQLVDDAYQKASSVAKIDGGMSAVVVNHHLLAADLIAETLATATTDRPITIILVSPNHFTRGTGQIISSRFDWQTPYGILKADQETITSLSETNLINVDEMPFAEEHGIYNIVPFIKKYFPQAKVVPLILKNNLLDDRIDSFALTIANLPNTLVVFSFDFSHYQTRTVADSHDAETIKTIHDYNFANIKNLDVDSRPGVRLMLELAKLKNENLTILHHANSADYISSITETTSYIDGVFINSQ